MWRDVWHASSQLHLCSLFSLAGRKPEGCCKLTHSVLSCLKGEVRASCGLSMSPPCFQLYHLRDHKDVWCYCLCSTIQKLTPAQNHSKIRLQSSHTESKLVPLFFKSIKQTVENRKDKRSLLYKWERLDWSTSPLWPYRLFTPAVEGYYSHFCLFRTLMCRNGN